MAEETINTGIKEVKLSLKAFSEDVDITNSLNSILGELERSNSIIQGRTLNLSETDENTYEATFNAPDMTTFNLDEKIFDVYVQATTYSGNTAFIDKNSEDVDDNNENFGKQCCLKVKEKNLPIIFSFPEGKGSFIKNPTIDFKISDYSEKLREKYANYYEREVEKAGLIKMLESGLDGTKISLFIDENPVSTNDFSINGDNFERTLVLNGQYNPSEALTNGQHELKVKVIDNDENERIESFSFKVDATAPTINLEFKQFTEQPAPHYTSYSKLQLSITTGNLENEENFTVKLYKNNELYKELDQNTLNRNGTSEIEVDLDKGLNEFTAIIEDSAKNEGNSGIVSVIRDSSIPTFKNIDIQINKETNEVTIKVVVEAEDNE